MAQKNVFQIVSLVVFGLFIVLGFAGLALFGQLQRPGSSNVGEKPTIAVWGVIPEATLRPILQELNSPAREELRAYDAIEYEQRDQDRIIAEFVNATARNSAPDVLLLPHELILDNADLFDRIPFSLFSRADYEATFISASNVFVDANGLLAVPLMADPLVLYYNRNLQLQNRITRIPTVWSELFTPNLCKYHTKAGNSR